MKLLSSLFPQNELIGIHIGYEYLCITVGGVVNNALKIEWQNEFIDSGLDITDIANFSHFLQEAVSTIPQNFKTRYLPVNIALPDPLFQTQLLQFAYFPKSYKEQYNLVNWQLAKLSHCATDKNDVTWQLLNSEKGTQNLFAYGVDKNIISTLRKVFSDAHLKLAKINAASFYRFNMLDSHALSQSGVLLALEKDYWNLMFWNEAGEMQYIHSDMRVPADTSDVEDIVGEAERLVLSYINKNKKVENIYITANNSEIDFLESSLNKNLESVAIRLAISGMAGANFSDNGIVKLATIYG